MTPYSRMVSNLPLLRVYLSCKCIALELLGVQGLPLDGYTGFATGTVKAFLSLLHPGEKSFYPTVFLEAPLFLSVYLQLQREHWCRCPSPCQTAVLAVAISSFRQDVFNPCKQ